MFGGQHAEFVRAAGGAGLFAAEGPGTAGQVAGQGVMPRGLVILGVVVVAPQGCSHAVTELGAVLETSMGRAVEGLKDLQGFQCGHDRFSNALHPTPSACACQPGTGQKRKFMQARHATAAQTGGHLQELPS